MTASADRNRSDAGARMARWLRPEVLAMPAYHVTDAANLIKLDAMENPNTWSADMRDAWLERLRDLSVNRYPEPRALGLRARVLADLSLPAGYDFFFGNGSDELIQLLCIALAGEGRSVLFPEPSFEMYTVIARYCGFRCVGVPLEAESFELDLPAMIRAIEQQEPALVFLASPNNPTGMTVATAAIREIAGAASGLVVLDEAYCRFSGGSVMAELADLDNLLVLHTLSKIGLAGLRVGLLIGNADWITEFDKIRLPYNLNTLSQAAAEFALEHVDVIDRQAAAICAERERVYAAAKAMPGVTAWPSLANFILLRVDAEPGGQAVHARLMQHGVLVKNLDGKHPRLSNCLRVTVGLPEENDSFLRGLQAALRV